MKKLLPLLLICCYLPSFAQKIESEEVDKFNGIKTVLTTKEPLVTAMGVSQVSIQGAVFSDKDNEEKLYTLYFMTRGTAIGSLTTDESSITLLMDDSSPMELKYTGKYKLFSAGDLLIISTTVSKEQLEILSAHKITDVRVSMSYVYDYKVKERNQEIVASISKLLLTRQ